MDEEIEITEEKKKPASKSTSEKIKGAKTLAKFLAMVEKLSLEDRVKFKDEINEKAYKLSEK